MDSKCPAMIRPGSCRRLIMQLMRNAEHRLKEAMAWESNKTWGYNTCTWYMSVCFILEEAMDLDRKSSRILLGSFTVSSLLAYWRWRYRLTISLGLGMSHCWQQNFGYSAAPLLLHEPSLASYLFSYQHRWRWSRSAFEQLIENTSLP